jgi:hypothetical protein
MSVLEEQKKSIELRSTLLQDLSRIQSYKTASQLPNQIIEIDRLSDQDVMKIFYRLLPSNIVKIGPFYIFYLLKDADPILWESMLDYIRIFYNQTCREKISSTYKKNFEDANLMVLCVSHDREVYDKYQMDLLNGFLIANYDVPKKEANIILICFQDIYNEGKKFKLGGGIFLHCLALNILTQLNIKDVYLEASEKNLIKYYGNIGYKLGKSPCGKRDKITDMYKDMDIDEIIKRLPSNYADEKYEYAYRMKWCGFDEKDICFKSFQSFRESIGNVKDEMLKSIKPIQIKKDEKFMGPENDPKRYKILKLLIDKDYYKEYYGVSVGNKLIKLHVYSKELDEKDLIVECNRKSNKFCDEIPCFIESFETLDSIVVITTSRDGYENLEEYLTKRFKNQKMDEEKITKNISKVLNDIYSLEIIPKLSIKSIGIFPETLEIYLTNIICNGNEKKNTLLIREIYDTIVISNNELNQLIQEIEKKKDEVIRRIGSKDGDQMKRLNQDLKKFGEKINVFIFKSYNITDNPFTISKKKKAIDKIIENLKNIHEILMNHNLMTHQWRNEWLTLLNRNI